MPKITVVPLSEHVAADIRGVDLSRPLDDAVFAAILEAFHAHAVIRIRPDADADAIDDADVVALSRRFGTLKIHALADYLDKLHPELMLVSNIMANGKPIGLKDAAVLWHSDMSYTEKPNPISVLVAHEVCRQGGGTQFTSMYAAWETLRPELKRGLDGRVAWHSIENYGYGDNQGMPAEKRALFPEVCHPVVVTHPVTGRKALYVSEGTTLRIDGLPAAESRAALAELFAHSVRPEFTWSQHWRVGDVVVWDNRCVMHRQLPYDPAERRLMKRTTVIEAHPGV